MKITTRDEWCAYGPNFGPGQLFVFKARARSNFTEPGQASWPKFEAIPIPVRPALHWKLKQISKFLTKILCNEVWIFGCSAVLVSFFQNRCFLTSKSRFWAKHCYLLYQKESFIVKNFTNQRTSKHFTYICSSYLLKFSSKKLKFHTIKIFSKLRFESLQKISFYQTKMQETK